MKDKSQTGGKKIQNTFLIKSKTIIILNASQVVQQQEISPSTEGDAQWYGHFRRQFGNFLQN